MDRRDSLKGLLVGSVAGGLLVTGCAPDVAEETTEEVSLPGYGRTVPEQEHDNEVLAEIFLNEHELETIAVLCDIILPAKAEIGGAIDAEVPAFIEFIVKDMPRQQLPMRGGLAWLDNHSNKLHNLEFKKLTKEQQLAICDTIAYPGKTAPELLAGEKFFTRIRNLTLTGYYTSELGIKDLGYQGNRPGVWDGVPQDVLDEQGLSYDEEWLAKCVDQSKRMDIAQWDDDGNLLT
ncbi:gluconate 2-dehydrogenase subunit 3 family protein [Roseivirga sp. E12]|uniref:gluconate 2-dehydrogenase subunit 3 family protein n=1 Tax=Roseivirga sp. E12 TaxID=2819237 RepID=UPI001ABC383C|nr:gluconate 2-dehydrogenase subunit 3 family protein [Roseivirga sp. E12]MBO3697098.1 gluconate 2-dehydrogenase subunit 3 family protein [Roseivirga sp. E12]